MIERKEDSTLGDIVRTARVIRRLTQEELGEAAECGLSTISNLENRNHLPKYKTIVKLCELLDLNKGKVGVIILNEAADRANRAWEKAQREE